MDSIRCDSSIVEILLTSFLQWYHWFPILSQENFEHFSSKEGYLPPYNSRICRIDEIKLAEILSTTDPIGTKHFLLVTMFFQWLMEPPSSKDFSQVVCLICGEFLNATSSTSSPNGHWCCSNCKNSFVFHSTECFVALNSAHCVAIALPFVYIDLII